MSKFLVIAGSGHCGTKWLATVLNERPEEVWYHELRSQITKLSWDQLDLYYPNDPIFGRYWAFITKQRLSVGDANSWPPHILPHVNSIYHIDLVYYLVRNEIQQLYSLMNYSPVINLPDWSGVLYKKLERLYQLYPNPNKSFDEMSRFEKLCLMVAANHFMPDYLRARNLEVIKLSLDELVSDPLSVKRLVPEFSLGQIEKLQNTDINNKGDGHLSPEEIWDNWPEDYKLSFLEMVN